MKKRVTKVVKMELPGGNAHPGPKLASAGVNMAKFCTDFNAKTGDRKGQVVPVIITAYEDKSYDFVRMNGKFHECTKGGDSYGNPSF